MISQGDVPELFDSCSIFSKPKLTLSCSELLCTLGFGLHILSLPRLYNVLRTRGRGIDRQTRGAAVTTPPLPRSSYKHISKHGWISTFTWGTKNLCVCNL